MIALVTSELQHRAVTTSLRPPRVAVLFYGGSSWEVWARRALRAAGQAWGASGFIYVPFDADGKINASMMRLVRRYDPDFIAIYRTRRERWAAAAPELGEALRPRVGPAEHVHPAAAQIAAANLAETCTPMRSALADGSLTPALHLNDPGNPLPAELVPAFNAHNAPPPSALVARAEWIGHVALFAAVLTGQPPGERPAALREQPANAALVRWIANRTPALAPEAFAWFGAIELSQPVSGMQTWSSAADAGTAAYGYDPMFGGGVVVVGDQAEDFALAVGCERLYGRTLWLPTGTADPDDGQDGVVAALQEMLFEDGFEAPIRFVSATCSDAQVQEHVLSVRGALRGLLDSSDLDRFVVGVADEAAPTLRLLLTDRVGDYRGEPVIAYEDGTLLFAHQLTVPAPAGADRYVSERGRPGWIVDVEILGEGMPRGRGLPSAALVAPDSGKFARIRSSRDGISFCAATDGFLFADSPLHHKLASPRPQFLGLLPWIAAQAGRQDVEVRLSRPGQHADLISRRVGGRERLRSLTGSAAGRMIGAFESTQAPAAGRVRLADGSSYLRFDRLLEAHPTATKDDVRSIVDELLVARLVRRGHILGCEECGAVTFLALRDADQIYECPRCGARNNLTADRWHRDGDEPAYYYDLHYAWRELLRNHGDVPLLLGHHLAASATTYSDIAEVEFFLKGKMKPEFEIDLIAHRDGEVIVGEGKVSGLGTGAARRAMIAKRCKAAQVIGADTVVFGTSGAAPVDSVQEQIRSQARAAGFGGDVQFVGDLGHLA